MAAVVGTPGLSALLAWPIDHLTEAANHWETVGERNHGVAHEVWSDAMRVDWQGEAAEALRADTHGDMTATGAVVDQLQAAARVSRRGASDLDAARSAMRYAVEDAHAAGFAVGEDLSVTDRMTGGSAAQRAARQAAAQAFAGSIIQRAAQLVSTDAQVAGKITTAIAGVRDKFPKSRSTTGHVHAFDSRTFKQGPDKPPAPAPKGPSSADMRKVIEKLPKGSRDAYREIKTPEDLERLKAWMTEHGNDIDSRYPVPGMGEWKRLPDGSEVGERNIADSTGRKALDIELKGADGTNDHWKVHINPKTGGVPDIPAAETGSVEPATAEPAPAESAPIESAPTEGFEGGGPAGIPVGPHFVHTPGSIDHGIPIIGEDDPGEDARDFKH